MTVGYHLHPPNKIEHDGWEALRSNLAALPKGTLTRFDALWHEINWDKNLRYGTEHIRAKLQAHSVVGGPVIVVLIPLPWPGSWGWSTNGPWGYVDEREFPQIAERFAWTVSVIRAEWKALGRKESDLSFQIGNEGGAGHPGGWSALPVGEFWERHGRLWLACLKAARFGRSKVIGPALSFQDHDEETARREWETAIPIYRTLERWLDLAALHYRFHAPWLKPDFYALGWIEGLERERKRLSDAVGLPVAVTESYIGVGDTPDVAAAAKIIVAHEWDEITCLYRVGWGPNDQLFELPLSAISASTLDSTLR